ncbi:MAG: ATP-binding protein [Deltaproteobacteria bacterium]|nr:ATP-binding protein [Deltaproteobacteria bacterium]
MIRRLLDLAKHLSEGKSFFLFGPRGVGKTSLVREVLKSQVGVVNYNLLMGETYRRFVTKTELFRTEIEFEIRKQNHAIVFVDEVQRIPALLHEVHYLIEEHKGKVQFILSGSSARKLRREEANLLAGRARYLKLHPITSVECETPLERTLQLGQLPSVIEELDQSYLEAYVDVYLREEIYQESVVRKQEVFTRFLDVAAQLSGELINFSRVGRLCGTSDNTVKEYFQILVDTLLVHRLEAWSYSAVKQLSQQPRFYFFDTGVLNAVRGEVSSEPKLSSVRAGKLFEHLVILEFIRLNDYYNRKYRFFHYRERDREIDLILNKSIKDPPIAIEIKIDGQPSSADLRMLQNFKSLHTKARCYCLTAGSSKYEENGVVVLPWKEGIQEVLLQENRV